MPGTLTLSTLVALALLAASPAYGGSSEVEQHLRDGYRGKTFVLRGFYSGNHLLYDSAGTPKGDAITGDWTSDGFVLVKEIRASHGRLTIEAERRLVIHFEAKEFQFDPEDSDDKRKLKIESDLSSSIPTDEEADAAMSKIFLTPREELADMVPDYWKPCVRTAGSGSNGQCRFAAEFTGIPGVKASAASSDDAVANCGSLPVAGGVPAGCHPPHQGRTMPKAIFTPLPEFSESAARAKFQGTATLMLVVDEQGLPTNVHVTKPLGHGLDAKALSCVKKWKFKPAEKDGESVPVEIAVQVAFHLY